MKIDSESQFIRKQVVKFIVHILIFPYHLLEMIFKPHTAERKLKALWEYLLDFVRWLYQAKATTGLILLFVVAYIAAPFFITDYAPFVFKPGDLLTLNLLPMLSSLFLHADLLHLGGNMIALFVVGRVVERKVGSGKLLLIFFGSALVSEITYALIHFFVLHNDIGGIGASGAISGVVAAAILIDPFYFTHLIAGIPLPVMLVGWLYILADVTAVLNPVAGDNVGHFAHLGGYIAVTAVFFILDKREREQLKTGLLINLALLALAVTLYNIGLLQQIESYLFS